MKAFLRQNFILILLICISFMKGVIWAYFLPPFQAPDEHHHYAAVQHYAEPKGYILSENFSAKFSFFDIKTQNLSPQLRDTLEKIQFENTAFYENGKNEFNKNSSDGIEEQGLRNSKLNRFIEAYPAWDTGYSPVYYKTASIIENVLSDYNYSILEKAFAIRMISVIIGMLFGIIVYFFFKQLNFTKIESAMLAAIVSFQPMLTFIFSIINIDGLLIFSFALFLLGAVSLLKNKVNFSNLFLIIFSTLLAINTKQTGYFLIVAILILSILYFLIYHAKKTLNFYSKTKHKFLALFSFGTIATLVLSSFIYFTVEKISTYYNLFRPFDILKTYFSYQFQLNVTINRSLTYWGNFGTPNVPITPIYIYIIWLILAVAMIGIILKLIILIKNYFKLKFDEKIYFFQMLFLVFMVIGLDSMIHYINFLGFNENNFSDPNTSIGTPGRYFLPVIGAKFALLTIGLSSVFSKIDRKKIIFTLFVLMMLFNFIALFNYIIPRYYL